MAENRRTTPGGLSKKVACFLEAVVTFRRRYGYTPSIREMMDVTGLRGTATVHWYLDRLIASGHLYRPRGHSLVLVSDGRGQKICGGFCHEVDGTNDRGKA